MIKGFWLKKAADPRRPMVPKGHRIYAIGDIHGRDDLLVDLLDKIEADRAQTTERAVLVFLGDLIDRGPHSSTVLERLSQYRPARMKTVFLMGNHEEAFLRAFSGDVDVLRNWLKFGGDAFVESYGLRSKSILDLPGPKLVEAIRTAVPKRHVEFLMGFHDSFRAGDYFFAHAGVRPGVPLEQQSHDDLRWIRAPFLEHAEEHGAVIVHGHTITSEVDERHNRIGIDTGAYKNGVLTALVLSGAKRKTLQSRAGEHSASLRSPVPPTNASKSAHLGAL